jgi:hypothetical protein
MAIRNCETKRSEVEQFKGEAMINSVVCRVSFIMFLSVLALAPLAVGQTSSSAQPAEVTITGTVTCSKYIYSKPDRKGFTAAEAIRMCASQGYAYVIVSGKNVYPLEGNKGQFAKLAGETVTVTGHVDTDRAASSTYKYHETIDATTVTPSTK